ncbi:MAG TPA: DUF929 family protein, partial [Acidimicrobiales bacterium]|nr:DUF929 family protein [Acidimicrobiales bacterium]
MAGTTQRQGGSSGTVPARPGARQTGTARSPRPGAGPASRNSGRGSARQTLQRRRQRNRMMAFGGGALVLVIVIVLVVSGLTTSAPQSPDSFSLQPNQVAMVTGVPVAALERSAEACAKDKTCFDSTSGAMPPQKLPSGTAPLSAGGHPEVVYVGANFCPFCAGERWAIVMALSKFGTFTGLRGTTSSATDTNANTPTFTFYGSTYKSHYLTFVTDEQSTNKQVPLQAPTVMEQNLLNKWDVTPWTSQNGSIPFVYLGGKYILTGIQYDASSFAGAPWLTAAEDITTGTSPVSKHAEAAAGFLVADLCTLTNGQPGSVCSQVPSNLKG